MCTVRRIVAAAIFCLLAPTEAVSQVSGQVTDSGGRPIHGALVELSGSAGPMIFQATDSAGRFYFQARANSGNDKLRVSYPGMTTTTISVVEPGTPLLIRLDTHPFALDPIIASRIAVKCPYQDEKDARQLWIAARSKYSSSTWARGLSISYLYSERSLESASHIASIPDTDLEQRSVTYVGATSTRTAGRYYNVNRQFVETGYAVRTGHERPYWRYPALEGRHAHHFASSEFGSRHTFHLLRKSEDASVLGFCPTATTTTAIQGTLVISADTTFVSTEWTYIHPERDEMAGGRVAFVPLDQGAVTEHHLLSADGILWWQHWGASERFTQRRSLFTRWTISTSDEIPVDARARHPR